MAILRVAQLGHPILRRVADPVDPEIIPSDGFQELCDSMLDTIDDYDGAGLAAPQVHYSLRLVLLTLDDEKGPEFMINPTITVLSETRSSMTEGCLSITGLRARVERPDHISVHFLDRQGQARAYELEGFPAIVTQHEVDHLDGILLVDRCDTKTLTFVSELERWGILGDESDESLDDDTQEVSKTEAHEPDDEIADALGETH